MEMIQIGSDKLKVMMSEKDMRDYELDCDEMDYNDLHTRHALREILCEAKRVCGFDASCDRMFVQIFPSRSGGCEIFVTLLDVAVNADKGAVPKKVFEFDCMGSLIRACGAVSALGYDGESQAYASDGNAVFLILDECSAVCGAYEFGEKYPADAFEVGRGEHMSLIASPDAVHILAQFDVR